MTDTNTAVEAILKADTKGRVRTTTERREALLAEFDRSGVSATKFAEVVGIKYQTFATWLQKRRRQVPAPAQAGDPVRWLEAVVEQAGRAGGKPASALRLHLSGGAWVEIQDAPQAMLAAALLRALAQPC